MVENDRSVVNLGWKSILRIVALYTKALPETYCTLSLDQILSLPEMIMRSIQLETSLEPKKAGRPRQHEDGAARVAAFRAKKAYPGHRHDIYLGEDAHAVVMRLKKKTGLSASAVVDAVLRGEITLPVTKR